MPNSLLPIWPIEDAIVKRAAAAEDHPISRLMTDDVLDTVTSDTLEQYRASHGDWVKVGDTVQVRRDQRIALAHRLDCYRKGYIEVDRRDLE